MNPILIGYIGLAGLMLIVLVLGMPVSFSMMGIGLLGMLFILPADAALRFLSMDVYDRLIDFPFSAIPMFILMGYYVSATGMTRRIFDVAYVWVGWMRGGLSLATVLACAFFSSMSGSSVATAAAVGKVAYPEMKRFHYGDSLATGVIASAGTLGPLIPPSTAFIIYGLLTEQSIGKLFVAGIVPGILLTIAFAITVGILCLRDPLKGPPGPRTNWQEKKKVLPSAIESVCLFALVIGGLFTGWFTPTQAGVAGAIGALLIGTIRRTLTIKSVLEATKEALQQSCMVMFLVIGAIIFGHFFSLTTIPMLFIESIENLAISPIIIVSMVVMFYIVGGFIMDAMGLLVLTIPIIAPAVFELGFDPIWFGVIMVMLIETGVITPPIGVNVFVVKSIVPEVPISRIFSGIWPFFVAICIVILIIIIFPKLATFLPSLIW